MNCGSEMNSLHCNTKSQFQSLSREHKGLYYHELTVGWKFCSLEQNYSPLQTSVLWMNTNEMNFRFAIQAANHYGCIRLASLGQPRYVAFFSPWRTRVIICTRLCWEKKHVTHRGRPRGAKRTHPQWHQWDVAVIFYSITLPFYSGISLVTMNSLNPPDKWINYGLTRSALFYMEKLSLELILNWV